MQHSTQHTAAAIAAMVVRQKNHDPNNAHNTHSPFSQFSHQFIIHPTDSYTYTYNCRAITTITT